MAVVVVTFGVLIGQSRFVEGRKEVDAAIPVRSGEVSIIGRQTEQMNDK